MCFPLVQSEYQSSENNSRCFVLLFNQGSVRTLRQALRQLALTVAPLGVFILATYLTARWRQPVLNNWWWFQLKAEHVVTSDELIRSIVGSGVRRFVLMHTFVCKLYSAMEWILFMTGWMLKGLKIVGRFLFTFYNPVFKSIFSFCWFVFVHWLASS